MTGIRERSDQREKFAMATMFSLLLRRSKMTLEMEQSGHTLNHPPTMPASSESPFVEKRREVRYATREVVDICILEMAGLRLAGILRDVSRNGLRIELSMPLNAGARLEIVLRNHAIIFGEARYCRLGGDAYQVGVVIEDIYYPKRVPANRELWIDRYVSADFEETSAGNGDDLMATEVLAGHLSRYDVRSFLRHNLSKTKAELVARHVASCKQCADLMMLTLADHASSVTTVVRTIEDDAIHV
jgi:hypothetical protein